VTQLDDVINDFVKVDYVIIILQDKISQISDHESAISKLSELTHLYLIIGKV